MVLGALGVSWMADSARTGLPHGQQEQAPGARLLRQEHCDASSSGVFVSVKEMQLLLSLGRMQSLLSCNIFLCCNPILLDDLVSGTILCTLARHVEATQQSNPTNKLSVDTEFLLSNISGNK